MLSFLKQQVKTSREVVSMFLQCCVRPDFSSLAFIFSHRELFLVSCTMLFKPFSLQNYQHAIKNMPPIITVY